MPVVQVDIHYAKAHLSKLLRLVEKGEDVTIASAGVSVARLVAIEKTQELLRPMGFERGKIWIADDFDAPLPDDLLKQLYGGELP